MHSTAHISTRPDDQFIMSSMMYILYDSAHMLKDCFIHRKNNQLDFTTHITLSLLSVCVFYSCGQILSEVIYCSSLEIELQTDFVHKRPVNRTNTLSLLHCQIFRGFFSIILVDFPEPCFPHELEWLLSKEHISTRLGGQSMVSVIMFP